MVLSAASYLKKAVEADRLAQTATEEATTRELGRFLSLPSARSREA